jgi:hypothetical protein
MAAFLEQANQQLDCEGFALKAVFVTFNTQAQAAACRAACPQREPLSLRGLAGAHGSAHAWCAAAELPWPCCVSCRLAVQLGAAAPRALPGQVPLLGGGSQAARGHDVSACRSGCKQLVCWSALVHVHAHGTARQWTAATASPRLECACCRLFALQL